MSDELDIPPPGYRVGRRSAGLDPATRRLATIAAGIGGALVVLVGVWSMLGGSTSGIPVVPPPSGPVRVKPANPGGMKVAGTNDRILGAAAPTAAPALAPPPETPDLQALRNPPPAPSAPASAKPVAAASTPPPPPVRAANGLPLPPPAPPPLQLAAASTAVPPPAAIGTGTATEVQLAAMNSKDGAMQEWQRLQSALPDLFGSRQPLVTKVEVDGRTFWRLRTAGFANVADATSFCAAVKAKGKGCAIAAF